MKFFYIILLFFVSGCKLFHTKKVDLSDSADVKKEVQATVKVDTSKTKTESTSTKETVYYPQPIYVQGKDGETKVVFVPQSTRESGTSKEEINNAMFESWQRSILDSMASFNKTKQSETKVKVLDFWQILALGVIGIMVIYLIGNKFLTLKK